MDNDEASFLKYYHLERLENEKNALCNKNINAFTEFQNAPTIDNQPSSPKRFSSAYYDLCWISYDNEYGLNTCGHMYQMESLLTYWERKEEADPICKWCKHDHIFARRCISGKYDKKLPLFWEKITNVFSRDIEFVWKPLELRDDAKLPQLNEKFVAGYDKLLKKKQTMEPWKKDITTLRMAETLLDVQNVDAFPDRQNGSDTKNKDLSYLKYLENVLNRNQNQDEVQFEYMPAVAGTALILLALAKRKHHDLSQFVSDQLKKHQNLAGFNNATKAVFYFQLLRMKLASVTNQGKKWVFDDFYFQLYNEYYSPKQTREELEMKEKHLSETENVEISNLDHAELKVDEFAFLPCILYDDLVKEKQDDPIALKEMNESLLKWKTPLFFSGPGSLATYTKQFKRDHPEIGEDFHLLLLRHNNFFYAINETSKVSNDTFMDVFLEKLLGNPSSLVREYAIENMFLPYDVKFSDRLEQETQVLSIQKLANIALRHMIVLRKYFQSLTDLDIDIALTLFTSNRHLSPVILYNAMFVKTMMSKAKWSIPILSEALEKFVLKFSNLDQEKERTAKLYFAEVSLLLEYFSDLSDVSISGFHIDDLINTILEKIQKRLKNDGKELFLDWVQTKMKSTSSTHCLQTLSNNPSIFVLHKSPFKVTLKASTSFLANKLFCRNIRLMRNKNHDVWISYGNKYGLNTCGHVYRPGNDQERLMKHWEKKRRDFMCIFCKTNQEFVRRSLSGIYDSEESSAHLSDLAPLFKPYRLSNRIKGTEDTSIVADYLLDIQNIQQINVTDEDTKNALLLGSVIANPVDNNDNSAKRVTDTTIKLTTELVARLSCLSQEKPLPVEIYESSENLFIHRLVTTSVHLQSLFHERDLYFLNKNDDKNKFDLVHLNFHQEYNDARVRPKLLCFRHLPPTYEEIATTFSKETLQEYKRYWISHKTPFFFDNYDTFAIFAKNSPLENDRLYIAMVLLHNHLRQSHLVGRPSFDAQFLIKTFLLFGLDEQLCFSSFTETLFSCLDIGVKLQYSVYLEKLFNFQQAMPQPLSTTAFTGQNSPSYTEYFNKNFQFYDKKKEASSDYLLDGLFTFFDQLDTLPLEFSNTLADLENDAENLVQQMSKKSKEATLLSFGYHALLAYFSHLSKELLIFENDNGSPPTFNEDAFFFLRTLYEKPLTKQILSSPQLLIALHEHFLVSTLMKLGQTEIYSPRNEEIIVTCNKVLALATESMGTLDEMSENPFQTNLKRIISTVKNLSLNQIRLDMRINIVNEELNRSPVIQLFFPNLRRKKFLGIFAKADSGKSTMGQLTIEHPINGMQRSFLVMSYFFPQNRRPMANVFLDSAPETVSLEFMDLNEPKLNKDPKKDPEIYSIDLMDRLELPARPHEPEEPMFTQSQLSAFWGFAVGAFKGLSLIPNGQSVQTKIAIFKNDPRRPVTVRALRERLQLLYPYLRKMQ